MDYTWIKVSRKCPFVKNLHYHLIEPCNRNVIQLTDNDSMELPQGQLLLLLTEVTGSYIHDLGSYLTSAERSRKRDVSRN